MAAAAYIELPEELFEVSGSSVFSGTIDVAELKAGPDTLRFAEPLPWKVALLNTGEGSLLVSGSVYGTARTECARCLEPFELGMHGEVEGWVFFTDPGDDLPEDMDEDEFEVVDEKKGVDLSTLLKAALVLDAPLVPLHDDDCKGLCPRCGANLNHGACGCGDGRGDDAVSAANPFAALKDFKFEN